MVVLNSLFVPIELRPQVIHWARTSRLSCDPGVKRTLFAKSRRFWWPSMEVGVREYIEACAVCARNKTSSGARMGLLQPLPIPSRPSPTSHSTSSRVSRLLKATPPFLRWWTGSQKLSFQTFCWKATTFTICHKPKHKHSSTS